MTRRTGKRRSPPKGPLSSWFDHVLLWVEDERASFEFYSKTLGFPVLNDDNERGLFTVGTPRGFAVSFHRKGVDVDGTGQSIETTGTPTVHFDFHVPDVDRAYESLRGRGVRFLSPPKDMPWGERIRGSWTPTGMSWDFRVRSPAPVPARAGTGVDAPRERDREAVPGTPVGLTLNEVNVREPAESVLWPLSIRQWVFSRGRAIGIERLWSAEGSLSASP